MRGQIRSMKPLWFAGLFFVLLLISCRGALYGPSPALRVFSLMLAIMCGVVLGRICELRGK